MILVSYGKLSSSHCDLVVPTRLQGEVGIDRSWEWMGNCVYAFNSTRKWTCTSNALEELVSWRLTQFFSSHLQRRRPLLSNTVPQGRKCRWLYLLVHSLAGPSSRSPWPCCAASAQGRCIPNTSACNPTCRLTHIARDAREFSLHASGYFKEWCFTLHIQVWYSSRIADTVGKSSLVWYGAGLVRSSIGLLLDRLQMVISFSDSNLQLRNVTRPMYESTKAWSQSTQPSKASNGQLLKPNMWSIDSSDWPFYSQVQEWILPTF